MEPLKEELKSEPEQLVSQSADESEPLADLGILLVHGIGQSRSSETLSRFGEPLVGWIIDWVGEFATADVEVVDALLGVEAEEPEVPAHARLRLSAPAADGSGSKSKDWLIAESWWAESFQSPTFGEIATWAVKVVPWTAFYHFYRRLRRALDRFSDTNKATPDKWGALLARMMEIGKEFLAVIAALLIAPILVFVLLLILLIGMIPIPQLRRLVAFVQRGLASTIGDSFALLGPKISSAGIYGRVARQLAWLEKRSKKVAVVAHSQGAAIAYRVVSTRASEKCGLLVTFGAGIRKLVQIRLLDRITGGWGWATSMSVIFFIIATLISRETLGLWQGLLLTVIVPLSWFVPAFVGGLFIRSLRAVLRILTRKTTEATDKPSVTHSERYTTLLGLGMIIATVVAITLWYPGESRLTVAIVCLLISFAWGWVLFANQKAGEDADNLQFKVVTGSGRPSPATEQPLPSQVRWLDFYAASDPVPNGPVFAGQTIDPIELRAKADGMESIPVHNRDSLLFDHTTYWQNSEDFVAEVADALGKLCNLELSNVIPLDHERRIVARHRRRWRVSWLRRARWLIAITAGAVWVWGDLASGTEWLLTQLIYLMTSLPWLGSQLESILPDEPTATTAAMILMLATGTAVAYGAIMAGWLHWESRDRDALISRHGYPDPKERKFHSTSFHIAWVVALTVGMIIVFDYTHWPWWVYLIVLVIDFFVASGIAGGADTFGYLGGVPQAWRQMLTQNDAWSEPIERDWVTKVNESTTALIEPAKTQDGDWTWQASIVLVPRTGRHDQTRVYSQTQQTTLYEAALWSIKKAKTTVATLGDQDYVPISEILTQDKDAGRAWQFWTDVVERSDFSDAQRAEALISRALLATSRDDAEQAITDCTNVIELANAPVSFAAEAYLIRAGILQEKEKSDAAVADYSAVIELANAPAEKLASAYLYRGLLFERRDQYEAAIADYTSIVDAEEALPGETVAQARAARGWAHYRAGDTERFMSDTQKALQLTPDKAWIGLNLALGKLLIGAKHEADALYDLHSSGASANELEGAINDIQELLDKQAGIDGLERNIERLQASLAEILTNDKQLVSESVGSEKHEAN